MITLSNYDREYLIKTEMELGDLKVSYSKKKKLWMVKNYFKETISSSPINAHEALKAAAEIEHQKEQRKEQNFLEIFGPLYLEA